VLKLVNSRPLLYERGILLFSNSRVGGQPNGPDSELMSRATAQSRGACDSVSGNLHQRGGHLTSTQTEHNGNGLEISCAA